MSTIHPLNVRIGDIVLLESIVVRTAHSRNTWEVSYHTDGIFRLAGRPQPETKSTVLSNPLHVPTVRFPWWL